MSILGAIPVSSSDKVVNLRASRDGKLLVVAGGTPQRWNHTSGGAIDEDTNFSVLWGRPIKMLQFEATFSTAPTTSEYLIITKVCAEGQRPDTVIFKTDPAATATTSVLNIWDGGYLLQPGDELTTTYTNTDTRTIDVELTYEVL